MIINAFQSLLEGAGLDLRFSSSPQPLWDHAAGCVSSWLFSCTADGELAHRTTNTKTATRAVRPSGCKSMGCLDPRGRHRDSDGPRPAESRPQRSSVLPRIGAGVGGYWRRCGFSLGTCSAKQASVLSNGAGLHPFSAPAPKDHETCTTQSLHLRQWGYLGIWEPFPVFRTF